MLGESQRVIMQSDGNLPPLKSRAVGFRKKTIQIYDMMKHEHCPLCSRDAIAAISTAEQLQGPWLLFRLSSLRELKKENNWRLRLLNTNLDTMNVYTFHLALSSVKRVYVEGAHLRFSAASVLK